MAFIGTPLDTRNTFQSLQGKRFNGDGSETDFTLDVAPSSVLDIEVFVGNVRQDPNSAYTLSGTTLTFTGAPPSGTNNIYVVHQAKSVGTIDPPATETIAKTFSGTVTMSGTNTLSGATTVSGALTASGGATISGTTPTLTIGDAGAEDTKIVFDGNAQDYHIGLDDSADSLTIGLGSTLGTTSHMVIDATGAITKPLQPAFLATIGSNQNNVADNTTLNFSSEIFDNNADFNTSNYTFTAPVTGKYFISFGVRLDNVDTASDYVRVRCITSNGNRGGAASIFDPGGLSGDPLYWGLGDSLLCDMDANDTATINFAYNSGAQQVDFPADNPEQTHFSAFLVC